PPAGSSLWNRCWDESIRASFLRRRSGRWRASVHFWRYPTRLSRKVRPSRRRGSRIAHFCSRRNCFVSDKAREARQNKLRQKMIDGKVDVLVVSFGPNVRYLSGFTGSNGVLLVLLERAIFLTD